MAEIITISPEARNARIAQLQKECEEDEKTLNELFNKFCDDNNCFADSQTAVFYTPHGIRIDQGQSGVTIVSKKRIQLAQLAMEGQKR